MEQDKITAKQQEILEYIKNTILKKGYPPAVREICEAVRLKSTSIHIWLHLRIRDISAVILQNREPLKFWMIRLILTGERW